MPLCPGGKDSLPSSIEAESGTRHFRGGTRLPHGVRVSVLEAEASPAGICRATPLAPVSLGCGIAPPPRASSPCPTLRAPPIPPPRPSYAGGHTPWFARLGRALALVTRPWNRARSTLRRVPPAHPAYGPLRAALRETALPLAIP